MKAWSIMSGKPRQKEFEVVGHSAATAKSQPSRNACMQSPVSLLHSAGSAIQGMGHPRSQWVFPHRLIKMMIPQRPNSQVLLDYLKLTNTNYDRQIGKTAPHSLKAGIQTNHLFLKKKRGGGGQKLLPIFKPSY